MFFEPKRNKRKGLNLEHLKCLWQGTDAFRYGVGTTCCPYKLYIEDIPRIRSRITLVLIEIFAIQVFFSKELLIGNSTLRSPKNQESPVLGKHNVETIYVDKKILNIFSLYFHLFLVSYYLSGT